MPRQYTFTPERRWQLARDARNGDMISAVMLEQDLDFCDAIDWLARKHGLPPYRKRHPATVIDLAEVRRLIAEADADPETHTDGGPDAA